MNWFNSTEFKPNQNANGEEHNEEWNDDTESHADSSDSSNHDDLISAEDSSCHPFGMFIVMV